MCGAKSSYCHGIGVGVEVAAEVYFIAEAPRSSADKACVVAGKVDVSRTNEEQVNTAFSGGKGDRAVGGDNGVIIDDDGRAFRISLVDVENFASRFVGEGTDMLRNTLFEAQDEIADSGGVEQYIVGVGVTYFLVREEDAQLARRGNAVDLGFCYVIVILMSNKDAVRDEQQHIGVGRHGGGELFEGWHGKWLKAARDEGGLAFLGKAAVYYS